MTDQRKYKISFCPLKSTSEFRIFQRGFIQVEVDRLERIAAGSLSYHWSGTTWKEGIKKSENFLESSLCILDFDNPYPTIEKCRDIFSEYAHFIVTTENHMKEKKGNAACNRFRVVIPWETPITNRDDFEYNMARLQRSYESDDQAIGAHVKFKPSSSIVFVKETGRRMFWERAPEKVFHEPGRFTGTREIPSRIHFQIENPGTSRWNAARRAAMSLANYGFDADEIINLFRGSPLMDSGDSNHNRKIIRTVKNGCKKVQDNPGRAGKTNSNGNAR